MIEINDTKYRLGLLDTCVLSRILRNENNERENYFNLISKEDPFIVPSISAWSIFELRARKELYEKFIDFFSILPFCLLKTSDHLLKEEYENYPYFNKIDPILFKFSPLKAENESLKELLKLIFNKKEIKEAEKLWKYKWKKEALDSMLKLKKILHQKIKTLMQRMQKILLMKL